MWKRFSGWVWGRLDAFLADLVARHHDDEGGRRRRPVTKPPEDGRP
jgi:hypothetical protein